MKFLIAPMQEMVAFEEAKKLLADKEVNIRFGGQFETSYDLRAYRGDS